VQVVAVLGWNNKQSPTDVNAPPAAALSGRLWGVLQPAARRVHPQVGRLRESLIVAPRHVVRLETEGRTTLVHRRGRAPSPLQPFRGVGREWNAQMLPGHLSNVSAELYSDFMAGGTACRASTRACC
jgi:hypothetical protein